jgi:threonine dehydrogenase-like Zn-dependent dehydrogenase
MCSIQNPGSLVIPPKDRPHPLTHSTLPVTLGHEFCGRVLRAPPGSRLAPGTPVVADPRLFCGSCHPCACDAHATNACAKFGFLGLSGGGGGGMSSAVAVRESMLHVLPREEDLEVAALLEPLAVVWHAVRKCELEGGWDGRSVLVLGGGPIGIAMVHVLKARGVGRVVVSEPARERKGLVEDLGVMALDPREVDVPEKCKEMTGGVGVEVVFDCAGVEQALNSGVAALRYGGLYMNVAGWGTPVS